jgi:predicted nucleic acid-binding protein
MIVLDASAVAFALLDEGGTGDRCRTILRADSRWLVPEQWLVEVLSVIRGSLLGGKIAPDHATDAAAAAAAMEPAVASTRLLAARIWELRSNLTTCDAAYVAAAEQYHCALVTTDARLARNRNPMRREPDSMTADGGATTATHALCRHQALGPVRANVQASATMSRRPFPARQPRSARMRSDEAIRTAGSPARRGAVRAGISRPVTSLHAASTSRFEKPVPLPRL